jgi:hypothetical protein
VRHRLYHEPVHRLARVRAGGEAYYGLERLGILLGTALSGTLGFFLLRGALERARSESA